MSFVDSIGILSFILGIIFFYKSKREKRPIFVYEHALLQSRNYPGITIHFQNQEVLNLRRLKVLFFNKGKKEIRGKDKPKDGFPKVIFPEGTKILAVNLMGASNQYAGIVATQINDSTLEVTFDYLNHNDGVVVEVLFDAGEVSKPEIQYIAPLIGSEKSRSYKYDSEEQNPSLLGKLFMAAMMLLVGFILWFLPFAMVNKFNAGASAGELISGTFVGLFVFAIFILGIWFNFLKPFRDAVPKWAKKYFLEK